MVFGILVVYSDNYFISSLIEFNRILRLTKRQYKLIVVFNNKSLDDKFNGNQSHNIKYDSVLGSNDLHEFSGWAEGLELIRTKYANHYHGAGYVFCNDTICHHRVHTLFNAFVLSACCNLALISRRPKIAGEVHSIEKDFTFNQIKFNSWVSTYFFVINKQAMEIFNFDILPTKELINTYLLGGHDENHFFSDLMDSTLRERFLHDLFHGGWHKSESLSHSNQAMFYCKARSIIAEFNLSSKAHFKKVDFIDTYYIIRLRHKLFNNALGAFIRMMLHK